MSTTINGVTVRFEREPEDWRKHQIVVQVNSRVKRGLKAQQEIDPGKSPDVRTLIRGVGAAAALCAEHLGMKYGDTVDPEGCIRDAIQAFGEEVRLIAELGADIAAKMKRLEGNLSRFDNKEAEVIRRMKYLVDKGENLTREELEWVNIKIGEIHGAQL